MSDWVCYLIKSIDSNKTYIGSSNDALRRLAAHNTNRGAKYTKGESWFHILIISGFNNKRECLSFEAGWKKLSKRRTNDRFTNFNKLYDTEYKYTKQTLHNRILDLLFFVHNTTLIGTHFKLDHQRRYQINNPENLGINFFSEEWAIELPWPDFITIH